MTSEAVDHQYIPSDPRELARCLADPLWRLSNLYKILVKGDDEEDGTVLLFRPNRAQRRFISRLWHRNIILKARQLGFTTLICILWLDHALFNSNQRCGVIAHTELAAGAIFRDKVKFAYDNLPPSIRATFPVAARNESEILFAHNNSSIRVATSMRSGTIHRLLVSEYGKICAEFPKKAVEVQTGSLPTVPANGVLVIESTAEGRDGDFYKKTKKAIELAEKCRALGIKDFRFHFYAWWQEPKYRIPAGQAVITTEYLDYFAEVEAITGHILDIEQRTWYVATKEGDFSGDDEVMWREYPSYPEEAFKVSMTGAYYGKQLSLARRQGRIGAVPWIQHLPVHTFWDLGLNDVQAIWFMQTTGLQHRFIDYYEASGEGVSHYALEFQKRGYVYGIHYIPHDGAHRRVTMDKPKTYQELMVDAGFKNTVIVPRVTHITTGIDMTREKMAQCWWDETKCAKGLTHLGNYRKQWNTHLSCWMDQPLHNEASNGADAFRQYGQAFQHGTRAGTGRPRPKTSWRTA